MSQLLSVLRAIVRDELRALRLGDLAVVTATHPHSDEGDDENHACDLRLRDGTLELARVPIATPHGGMVSAPRVGDLVLVTYVQGDPERPIVLGRLYSDEQRAPVHADDEWRVEAKPGGSSIAIDAEGAVVITSGKTSVTLEKDGKIRCVAETDLKIEVEGNVELACSDCTIDASGSIQLGKDGSNVITEGSHKCYFTGSPLVGSASVKAKG